MTVDNAHKAKQMVDDTLSDPKQDTRTRIEEQIDQFVEIIAETLFYDNDLQDRLIDQLEQVKNSLQRKSDVDLVLSRADFEVKRVRAVIAQERQKQNAERSLRWIVPSLIILYTVVIIAVIAFAGQTSEATTEIPIVGIPLSVLVWSAIGSLAAILYRFYARQPEQMTHEIRWLIARPIIGIIMGSLAYISIVSGLLIFGTATGLGSDVENAKPQLLWIIAFLGGFSDRFFEAIIESVVGRFSGQSD